VAASPHATFFTATNRLRADGPAPSIAFLMMVLVESNRSRAKQVSRCADGARPELVAITIRVFTDSYQRMLHCRPLTAMPTLIGMAVILITRKPVRMMEC
jgi:hypothetical protein